MKKQKFNLNGLRVRSFNTTTVNVNVRGGGTTPGESCVGDTICGESGYEYCTGASFDRPCNTWMQGGCPIQ